MPRNPFTPTFGMVPPFMAGRERILEDMASAFEDGPGNPNLSSILIGARGTGKTALLSRIAEESQTRGWLAVNVVAGTGMLEDIVQQVGKKAAHILDPTPERKLSAIGIGQLLNLEWVFEPKGDANWRTRMEALLDQIESQGFGLVITVDEVRVDVEEMIQLASVYQLFIRDGRKVSLIMAGLPAHVTDLIDDKRVTFLRRARQHYLGRIDDREVRQALEKTIEYAGKSTAPGALDIMVAAADGFAYMMQLVGYYAWNENRDAKVITREDAERGAQLARDDFEHGVLETTYREMSAGDRAFANAMLPDAHGSKLAEVARRMQKSTSYASTYKRRLLQLGIIGERAGNTFDFDMPYLREYLQTIEGE